MKATRLEYMKKTSPVAKGSQKIPEKSTGQVGNKVGDILGRLAAAACDRCVI